MRSRRPVPEIPGPGQESVWDYPRPPKLDECTKRVHIIFNGQSVADTTRALRILETSHPPTYYIHRTDIKQDCLAPASGDSWCEWKGRARYVSVRVEDRVAERVGWYYPEVSAAYSRLKDHIAFFAGPMDACHVGDDIVTPQPGGFYGGWITPDIVGPFKGGPGTMGW